LTYFRALFSMFLLVSLSLQSDDAPASHLGKIDKSSFSQQTLMELFLDGITKNKNIICGDCDTPKPVAEWRGVTTNADGEVTMFRTIYCALFGTPQLQWLPESVTKLDMTKNLLTGTLDLSVLPESLECLVLADNKFSGEIALESLHQRMCVLNLGMNQLSGSLKLESLPDNLKELYLDFNSFSGTVCLTNLPASMISLSINDNKLHGGVDLTRLPDGLASLFLGTNGFCGETDFSQLPFQTLKLFVVDHTQMSGTVVVPQSCAQLEIMAEDSQVVVIQEHN